MQYASFGVLSNFREQHGKTSGMIMFDTIGSIADLIYGKSILLFVAHVFAGRLNFLSPTIMSLFTHYQHILNCQYYLD